jgi:hypothetical protein
MADKTVQQESVEKALSALKNIASEDISKGGPNTISSKVESMSSVGGASQVFHTPSDSNPGTFAGSTQTDVPENGCVSTTANGTDYSASAVVKSILELHKSGKISAEAAQVLLEKAMPFEKKEDDEDEEKKVKKGAGYKEEDKDEDKDDVAKSFGDSDALRNGFEATEFLREFAGAIAKAIKTSEDRTVDRVVKALTDSNTKSEAFQKSLAGAVSNLGDALVAQAGRVEEIASAPARGAKSTQVQVLSKSFAGNVNEAPSFTKAQLLNGMVDLVQKGQLHSSCVLRFEAGSEIEESILNRVTKHLSAGN